MAASLPIVDLSADPAMTARTIDAACTGPGFFYLVDHGVPAALIDRTAEHILGRIERSFGDRAKLAE